MRNLVWICCFLWESLPTLTAYPLNPAIFSKADNSYWELYYTIGLLGITATAFTLVGCLCCRRNRPKGFQDNEENNKQEFKNGNDNGLHTSFHGLELEVPQGITFNDHIQFEPLPVERIINETNIKPKPPLSPSIFEIDNDSDQATISSTNQEWQNATDIHVPREKLKYVREVGHGWFGKVVEGCIDLSNLKRNLRSGNVVVRILTEEATAKEKAWFLGEATPYFKLRHRNILSLLGSCLEADPYLLLFEACPPGDLKGFLRANNDPRSRETLIKENMPIRIAIEVAAGLRHMHEHGFAHTDLSARNCLVAADLSIKLGDYGTGVEKYPEDYYVLGDRALPIRWSAPESLLCTETTIETREITHKANIWSYAILLWEIATWGERPYNNLGDEQVIQILLSTGPKAETDSLDLLMSQLDGSPSSMIQAIRSGLVLAADKRPDLAELRHMLLKDKLDAEDFEQRWENLKPTKLLVRERARSASLQDLRGSVDSECWSSIIEEKQPPQAMFRLGPEEPIKNIPGVKVTTTDHFQMSDSETEEESWRGRIERGAYTEKVKQKSKSVADLMVLVYIDPDSDADMSLGPQITEKPLKKRLNITGSDSDLHSTILEDNFDQALKKLREPTQSNISDTYIKSAFESLEKLNQITSDTIIKIALEDQSNESRIPSMLITSPQLNYDAAEEEPCFSNNFDQVKIESNSESEDITLWNNALDSALEHKVPGFLEEAEFQESSTPAKRGDETGYNSSDTVQLTPSSLENDGEFSNVESPESQKKQGTFNRLNYMDEEEYRKSVSTPDDERSSDSGFRDKESFEDEESPLPRFPTLMTKSPSNNISKSIQESAEEEQLRILLELDTMLDAEYTGTPTDSLEYSNLMSSTIVQDEISNRSTLNVNIDKCDEIEKKHLSSFIKEEEEEEGEEEVDDDEKEESYDPRLPSTDKDSLKNEANILDICDKSDTWQLEHSSCTDTTQVEASNFLVDSENEDDSSTVSLRSDNSYISFNIDEEFVTAIRNELREKLPHAQMLVVEPLEPRDEDEPSSITSDVDSKSWDEDCDSSDQGSGVDIAIRYNIYGTQLSPILEERESALNSESLISKDDSKDDSIVSKGSVLEEDMLLVDTRTNEALLLERSECLKEESCHEKSNIDTSDEEDNENNEFDICSVPSMYSMEKRSGLRIGGSGAPLPSPEEESKWQTISCSFPLPVQMHDDCMMSTSFASERDWNNQDEGEEEEDNSSSSGEFVWKRYDKSRADLIDVNDDEAVSKIKEDEEDEQVKQLKERDYEVEDQEADEDLDEEEEEFTPSAWDATLAPHRSALRSPDKTLKTGDQKKSVWFKKQNYHCVYEYPKEVSSISNQEPTTTTWEPTSYADWEEMMDEARLDLYPLDYDDSNSSRNDEFYVTSSNRPFQFQSSDKYTSQFFPGASSKISQVQSAEHSTSHNKREDEIQSNIDNQPKCEIQSNIDNQPKCQIQQSQLGELRHTRDRLKLNLTSSNGANVTPKLHTRQNSNETFTQSIDEQIKLSEEPNHDTIEEEPRNSHDGTSNREENAQEKVSSVSSSIKLSPSERGNNVDYNENCGFLEHG